MNARSYIDFTVKSVRPYLPANNGNYKHEYEMKKKNFQKVGILIESVCCTFWTFVVCIHRMFVITPKSYVENERKQFECEFMHAYLIFYTVCAQHKRKVIPCNLMLFPCLMINVLTSASQWLS